MNKQTMAHPDNEHYLMLKRNAYQGMKIHRRT